MSHRVVDHLSMSTIGLTLYTKPTIEEVMDQIWQGIPIINRHMGMNVPLGSQSMPHQLARVRPGYVEPPTQVPFHLPLVF